MTKLDMKRCDDDTKPSRRSPITPNSAELARAFYCGVLRGQELLRTERIDNDDRLSFLVAGTRFDASMSGPATGTPVVLVVDDPVELAERCWDAGFTVRILPDPTGRAPISLTDPFGRRIHLVPRSGTLSVTASA
jgi:hypothetical protein